MRKVTLEDLAEFISSINQTGLSAFTQARIISGTRTFFKYLMLEEIIDKDPSELLDSPQLGRKLPEVLNIDDISRLISSIDLSHPEGERNKAIMETLYGCGLRVSELVNLRISDLHFKEGMISVTGKGNKQRLVPIGTAAIRQINIYRQQVRIHLTPQKGCEDILFLNRRGGQLSRQMIFLMIRKQAE
ncbi:MAG: tyrosine-type recombinase/integrase, partial [bacterium]